MIRKFSILLGLAFAAAIWPAAIPPAYGTETSNAAATREQAPALDGRKLFASSCGFCHSKGGRKAGKGPKLANSPRSDEFIIKRIRNGKTGRMPGFARAFDDEKIEAILVYIRSLEDLEQ